jgi:hypothetical protein
MLLTDSALSRKWNLEARMDNDTMLNKKAARGRRYSWACQQCMVSIAIAICKDNDLTVKHTSLLVYIYISHELSAAMISVMIPLLPATTYLLHINYINSICMYRMHVYCRLMR